jgi:hypothetical protein
MLFLKILCKDLPRGQVPSDFRTKILYAFLTYPMHPACPSHSFSLVYLITVVISAQILKLFIMHFSAVFCHFLSFPNVLLAPCSQTPTPYLRSSPGVTGKFHAHTAQAQIFPFAPCSQTLWIYVFSSG